MHANGRVEKLPDEHRTGDLGIIDKDGHITVVGRLKDLIIRGGVNISPVEIDNILSRHPDIIDAAACGVPDKVYGEEVICFVISRKGSDLTSEIVLNHCEEFLSPFKAPKEVIFTKKLPKNERGKLARKALSLEWEKYSNHH